MTRQLANRPACSDPVAGHMHGPNELDEIPCGALDAVVGSAGAGWGAAARLAGPIGLIPALAGIPQSYNEARSQGAGYLAAGAKAGADFLGLGALSSFVSTANAGEDELGRQRNARVMFDPTSIREGRWD